MKKKLLQYLGEQSKENFLKLRQDVIDSPAYSPYSEDLDQLERLYIEEQYEELIKQTRRSFPNLLLSPKAHLLLSLAHSKLTQPEDAKMEQMIFAALIKGIQLTGDGSKDKPYIVCRTSDEYDLMMALEKNSTVQALLEHEDKLLDRQQLEDGSEIFFDVTAAMKKLDEHAEAAAAQKRQSGDKKQSAIEINIVSEEENLTPKTPPPKIPWWKFW